MNKDRIKAHMRRVVDLAIERETGEVNATLLAELCADDLDHPEWLDDETHDIWDAACEVAWEYRR